MHTHARMRIAAVAFALLMVVYFASCGGPLIHGTANSSSLSITNVSYDPTRELYEHYNQLFVQHYKELTGLDVEVIQSHGGSGKQARSVIEGADADVVTLALAHDISLIEYYGIIDPGWQDEFPLDSSPYTSTIVFLVRAGNPKNIHDWNDLVREDVDIIAPNPKSSGAACWNFLAAWSYAEKLYGKDENKIRSFMHDLYANVLVMDSGARGSTTTFVENGQGDVLVSWENEAIASLQAYPGQYELVTPSLSILCQPSVAVVDENAYEHKSEELAQAYLSYLYSDEAQELIGQMGYRPSNELILALYADSFDLEVELVSIADFGGWDAAYETYFKDGGVFDQVYTEQG